MSSSIDWKGKRTFTNDSKRPTDFFIAMSLKELNTGFGCLMIT